MHPGLLWSALVALTVGAQPRDVTDAVTHFGSVEQVALPANVRITHVDVRPLERQISLTLVEPRPGTRWRSALCPRADVQGTVVVLRCGSGRVDAAWIPPGDGGPALLLRERRGLPLAPLRFRYVAGASLEVEDALQRGALEDAGRLLLPLDGPPQRAYRALRLGDVSAERGAFREAAAHYAAAGTSGAYARIAAARLCDLTGACEVEAQTERTLPAAQLDEPLRTELELRAVLAEATHGDLGRAAHLLLDRIEAPRRPALPASAQPLLRAVARATLVRPDGAAMASGVALYLHLPDASHATEELELTRRAARATATLGAAGYAARLLGDATPRVPRAELGAHVAELERLYVEAGDPARADAIREFARSRRLIGPRKAGPRAGRTVAPLSLSHPDAEAARATAEEGRALLAKLRASTR